VWIKDQALTEQQRLISCVGERVANAAKFEASFVLIKNIYW